MSADKHIPVSNILSVSVESTPSTLGVQRNRLILSQRNHTTTAQNNKTVPLCCLECWKFQTKDLKIHFQRVPTLFSWSAWPMAARSVTADLRLGELSFSQSHCDTHHEDMHKSQGFLLRSPSLFPPSCSHSRLPQLTPILLMSFLSSSPTPCSVSAVLTSSCYD